MNRRAGAALLVLALLSWFAVPGHAWLEQDTQIYVPILERLRDPSVLRNDLVAANPHVAYTLYDEAALALARLTGLGFEPILKTAQPLFRAMELYGIYLMATALDLPPALALLAAALFSLGATVAGPAVETVEAEPVPRAFAVPLVFLAAGLMAHGRFPRASLAASAALLLHAPSAYPFWILYLASALRARRWTGLAPPLAAAAILYAASRHQAAGEAQNFLARLPPHIEALQRMRAPYNWISTWWRAQLPHYLLLFSIAAAAFWRLRGVLRGESRLFAIGLPAIGMLSMPLSWLLLERVKWALIPQLQPMRALLFVTALAMPLAVAAGWAALRERRRAEALLWLAMACCTISPPWRHPAAHDLPPVRELSRWARGATPPDAVFQFAGAGKDPMPGIFRARALRAVYVDWKGGGQVNYLPALGDEWWRRWRAATGTPLDAERARSLGIDYLVLRAPETLPGRRPLFENAEFLVYGTAPHIQ